MACFEQTCAEAEDALVGSESGGTVASCTAGYHVLQN